MKLLIIGSGAREHALTYKLSQDMRVNEIFVAPGNGGTATEVKTKNIDIKANDINALLEFAKSKSIDLTITGGEEALSLGIVDLFEKEGLTIFGPTKAAAEIEASKAFAKDIMSVASIPTATYEQFEDYDKSMKYIETYNTYPVVIKADGLAAGKGVTIAYNLDEAKTFLNSIFNDKVFGDAGNKVIIEEFMKGEEATYTAITDGDSIYPLDISQDHKPINDNDTGPNTGGMGAYTPVPLVDNATFSYVTRNVVVPMLRELHNRGIPYRGVIYAGLMIDKSVAKDQDDSKRGGCGSNCGCASNTINTNEIRVVEFNARFGDPECQVIVSRLDTGVLDVLLGSAKGEFGDIEVKRNENEVVTVVIASKGYPDEYKTGHEITGIEKAEEIDGVKVYHAGTKIDENGKLVTSGGRVLSVTAMASTLEEAKAKAYKAIKEINFQDMYYRTDISDKAFKNN